MAAARGLRTVARLWLWMGLGCGSAELEAPEPPLFTTVSIRAASGGEVVLEGGARLGIEPAGLDRDSEVTLSRETCRGVFASSSFESCLFKVEGHGALLDGRLSLSLPKKQTSSMLDACAVRESAGAWTCLADTRASQTSIDATAASFALFSARVVSSERADLRVADVDFEPCGGALEGAWTLVQSSGTTAQVSGVRRIGEVDPYAACAPYDHYEDRPMTFSGAMTFSMLPAGQTESGAGTYEHALSATVRRHTITTRACLERVGESCLSECTREGDLCECLWSDSSGTGLGSGYWDYASNGQVSLDGILLRYCVEGDTLRLERVDSEGPYFMIYERGRR